MDKIRIHIDKEKNEGQRSTRRHAQGGQALRAGTDLWNAPHVLQLQRRTRRRSRRAQGVAEALDGNPQGAPRIRPYRGLSLPQGHARCQLLGLYQQGVDPVLHTDNERSIPSLVDGMKPGQRKVLFTCFKRADKEVKVAQLAGAVGEMSAYHHGEQSLIMTIVILAQDSSSVPSAGRKCPSFFV
ncbi:hypothetical protein L596_001763 [Steinernema carpocapsae]|uniref:DNA topoisomerase (ATP-hydrolyzing) n=1 Tax=Steinernema carpocapsae TaxID=34508 RepID=A0A4U8UMG7_STECR|nr:hypothetical protein L596_001763 [Steinernema carpocapsae]